MMETDIYFLKTKKYVLPRFIFQAEENLVEKPWGGEYIAKLKGINAKKIGESWEFSAHPSRPSLVAIDGKVRFNELVDRFKREILGSIECEDFPLLVKIIDANENLSVQVHPSERDARMLGEKDHGKEEAWIVLDADEGAKIYIGFKEDVDPNEFLEAVKRGDNVLEYLNAIRVDKGDAFFIPSGTIHALGKGVRVLEVSGNSDITYRVYDYGRGRELHLDKAFKVLKFSKTDIAELRQVPKEMKEFVRCIDTPYFVVDRVVGPVEVSKDTFHILLCIAGNVELKSDSESVRVERGRSVLIPAITEKYGVEVDRDSEVYLISPISGTSL